MERPDWEPRYSERFVITAHGRYLRRKFMGWTWTPNLQSATVFAYDIETSPWKEAHKHGPCAEPHAVEWTLRQLPR